ncbi:hypothetical protein Csa_011877 [Cucumis sativus]|uniref:Uncharacterized protein n=1 Tax=Cucumis sativus TaxID=3659 RepID=A0A0A0K8C5_CUCSA|nr:hypothetical protein Csa_011877 [Cucumis sativus]
MYVESIVLKPDLAMLLSVVLPESCLTIQFSMKESKRHHIASVFVPKDVRITSPDVTRAIHKTVKCSALGEQSPTD